MKRIFVLSLFFLMYNGTSLRAQSNSKFAHPLQIEPVAIYNKLRLDASYWDNRDKNTYEQNKNVKLEGEYNFWNQFSVTSSIGRTNYKLTDSEPSNSYDRWNLGLKYGKIFDIGNSNLLVGGGIKLYDRKRGTSLNERENPEYYLISPNLGLGFKTGNFEIMSEFKFQTESNRNFKEGTLEEFRRFYQIGIAPSYAISSQTRGFLEFEYREPYDKIVDTKTRYFNFYPGVSYNTENIGTFSLSLQVKLLSKEESSIDRGIKFSYFYFF